MPLLLGCIADDFTGGTDVAGMLVKNGMRTIQSIGIPQSPLPDDIDAVVIALKSRTCPADKAVEDSLEAARWLKSMGCLQYYFKYCSTFDSTSEGNIGPVIEALMHELETDFTIACPAFPANKRTIYKGHLFVGDSLLSDSGMKSHPLTPMTDSNLVRVLSAQMSKEVGLIDYSYVSVGSSAIRYKKDALQKSGVSIAVVDALSENDLFTIGEACIDLKLITAGSGLAIGLPENFRNKGLLENRSVASEIPQTSGYSVVLSGSCSTATLGQVADMRAKRPSFHVDAMALARGEDVVENALHWAKQHVGEEPVLFYASASPSEVKAVQAEVGTTAAGELVEAALAKIAVALVEHGVDRMVVAGGETSGAVVKALNVDALRIGTEIDPGVPWTSALGTKRPLSLALKSGNFGSEDFFTKAWRYLA